MKYLKNQKIFAYAIYMTFKFSRYNRKWTQVLKELLLKWAGQAVLCLV